MSASSTVSEDTWPPVIAIHRQRLVTLQQTLITNEEDHRKALTQLCSAHRERDATRLLGRIRTQHSPIVDLANAVDSALQHKAQDKLITLVWSVSVAAIRVAFDAKKRLSDFTKLTQKLNEKVPSLHREHLRRYHEVKDVRRPLLRIFDLYMASYLAFFSDSAPHVLNLEGYDERITEGGVYFNDQKNEWEEAFAKARDQEQERVRQGGGTVHGNIAEPMVQQQRTAAHFDFVKNLGQGGFGHVTMVKQFPTGDLFAQKFIPAPKDGGTREVIKKNVMNEVMVMKKLQHHHIASILLWTEVPSGFNLIMPTVAECNLRNYLERDCVGASLQGDEDAPLDNWFGCLLTALAFAHSNKVKHVDLKPSNILIKDQRVYLADFGCAKDFEQADSSVTEHSQITGTPVYWPPEYANTRTASDVFSLGCVFSEMLTVRQGESLKDFQEARRSDSPENPYAYRKSLQQVRTWLSSLPDVKSRAPKLLLKTTLAMLEEKSNERESAHGLKRWLRQEDDILFCGSCS